MLDILTSKAKNPYLFLQNNYFRFFRILSTTLDRYLEFFSLIITFVITKAKILFHRFLIANSDGHIGYAIIKIIHSHNKFVISKVENPCIPIVIHIPLGLEFWYLWPTMRRGKSCLRKSIRKNNIAGLEYNAVFYIISILLLTFLLPSTINYNKSNH